MRRRDPAATVFSEIEALQSHRELAASLAQKEGVLLPLSSTAGRRVLMLLDDRALTKPPVSRLAPWAISNSSRHGCCSRHLRQP
jgi:hypothetical protein